MYSFAPYTGEYESQWDQFVGTDSINGTFLHSRNFLNYHPESCFADCSFLIFKGNHLAAVIPACVVTENSGKIFSSHAGSTFGGLVIHRKYYTASNVIEMIQGLEDALKADDYKEIRMKITSDLFSSEKSDLLQYALSYCGYGSYGELSTYIDFECYKPDIRENFGHGQKENLRLALKNGLTFKKLDSDGDIACFYAVLSKNLMKFNANPVHRLEELLDLKRNRLKDIVDFYGVFFEGRMIAGAMTFQFDSVIHTQYLAADSDYSARRPMTCLYYNLIETVRENGFKKLSWGISTEKRGRILNGSLLSFKESFGSKYILNRGFYKILRYAEG
ncbi:MAG: GNAT family N-acetyltransferase [Dysgonamonadaceae bacterium]|jgi:hypothetical protein|nr:GNAT family N-acetyltransferase [Dysgonamonadaceae bacterium]